MAGRRIGGKLEGEGGEAVAWEAPDGSWFLVGLTESGYRLYSSEEYEGDELLVYEADLEGNVYARGEPLGWRLPGEILRKAAALPVDF